MSNETNATNSNGQLGHIVAWRVPSQVSLDALRAGLRTAGLDEDLAGDLHPRHVLSRALRDMKQGRVIAKLQSVSDDAVSFQLTAQLVGSDSVDYQREAIVHLDLRSGVVSADDAAIEQRARELVAEHSAKRMTSDLTRLVQHLYDAHKADLVPIREQGGAYFVPDAHSALVDQSRVFLGAIGGRLNSFAVRLGCGDTAESVADAMADYITGLVAEFRASCADLTPESRQGVIGRRAERISELRQRLECYRGLLGATADGIDSAIKAAEAELLARISAPMEEETNP